jgi:hypothetical protein
MNKHDLFDILGETPQEYILDAQAETVPVRIHSPRRMWLIAAIIAAMVFLMGCAWVVMSLDKLALGKENIDLPGEQQIQETQEVTVLSLQGYQGTPGYQASLEWNRFLDEYDPDLSILKSLPDYRNTGIPMDYEAYTCYTQEMKDKIDEICEKCDLELLGRCYVEDTETEFFGALGMDGIIADNAQAEVDLYPEYYYQDGTFTVWGFTSLVSTGDLWQFPIEFSLRCVMKSSLDAATFRIQDPAAFTEWIYTTADGTEALLALSEEGGVIVVDREDSFITILVETTVQKWYMEQPKTMTRKDLEAFVDTFNLKFRSQKPDIAAAQAREEARYQEYQNQMEEAQKNWEELQGVASYAERIRYCIEEEYHSERYGYTLMDLDGNGVAELLIGQDGWFKHMYSMVGDSTIALIDANVYGSSDYYLCEDNVIAKVIDQYTYRFGKVAGDHIQWDVTLEYNDYKYPENPWRSVRYDGKMKISDPISEAEFNQIIQSYKRIVVDTKPLSEYPQDKEVGRDPEKMYPNSLYKNFEDLVLSWLDDNGGGYSFALLDFDGNGQQELISYGPTATAVYTMTYGTLNEIIMGFELRFCEGNIIEKLVRYSEDTYAVCYYRLVNGNQTEMIEYLRYDADRDPANPWFRSADASGFDESLVPVTEMQFKRILDSYESMDLQMKPLSEYPFEP